MSVQVRQGSNEQFSKDDQQNINNFSRLNMMATEKSNHLVQIKEVMNQIDDAITELDLHDDDTIGTKLGDCFFHMPIEDATEYLERQQEAVKKETELLQKEVEQTQKKMGKLKASLYAKFGNSINLEDD